MIHVSAKHGAVLVPSRPDLANLFPHAKTLTLESKPYLVLPHDLDETRLLRNMGLDVPAPILSRYDWCRGKPFDVQRKTAAMLTTNRRGYVLNSMGTGKTKSAIWSFDFLRSVGKAKRMLVCAPLSTLNFTWAKEIMFTCPHLKPVVLHGTRAKRLERLAEPADVYIVNPDGLELVEEALAKRPDIDVFCIDELATFRNPQAKRSKVAKRIAGRMSWVWGMTGSPTPNEPTDAYGQAVIVTPDRVPRYFTRYREELMLKVGQFRYVPKADAAERVLETLQPAVRFSLDDVVELPPVVYRTIDIELGKKQAKVYETIRQHAHALVGSKEITAVNAGAVLQKLLQVSLGYVYTRDREVATLDNDLRLDALVDAVEATDRKVLVFVPFTHALHGVAARLAKEKIEHAVVDGSTPQSERGRIFSKFQSTDRLKVVVAHPGTISHGLTLTAAATVIWFGPTTSLETYEQANARIRRVGQTHRQQIVMFQSTPVEKRIYARLRAKQKVQNNILDLFAEATNA